MSDNHSETKRKVRRRMRTQPPDLVLPNGDQIWFKSRDEFRMIEWLYGDDQEALYRSLT